MSVKSEAVKKWRQNTKKRIIESMGGKCQICGYDRCDHSLALHHIDPAEKEISFGAIRANPKNWLSIVDELRKCILLCHNCHSEVHAGITNVPTTYQIFDENFVKYKAEKIVEQDECPVCNKLKSNINRYCSNVCSGKAARKVDWDSVDLPELLKTHSVVAISEILNVSDVSVHKRMKKLGLK